MRLQVQDILDSKNIPYRIIELKDKAISINDVIKYSKEEINSEEICKTILVKQKIDYYALFLKGSDRIDFKKLKEVIGKSSIASKVDVLKITGVDAGAVCPLLLDIPIIVDVGVLSLEKINFSSGNHLFGVEIASTDLARVLNYLLADITE
jgi:prolyl-tRNA editing enzyme YbaK/EbsC (Cys-tRNA(Pro) deacylase)